MIGSPPAWQGGMTQGHINLLWRIHAKITPYGSVGPTWLVSLTEKVLVYQAWLKAQPPTERRVCPDLAAKIADHRWHKRARECARRAASPMLVTRQQQGANP